MPWWARIGLFLLQLLDESKVGLDPRARADYEAFRASGSYECVVERGREAYRVVVTRLSP